MQSHRSQRLNCDQCCLNCDSYMDNCKIAAEVRICANNTKLEQSNLLCSKFAIRMQLHSRQCLNCDQCCLNCDPHAQAVQGCHHKPMRKIRKSPSECLSEGFNGGSWCKIVASQVLNAESATKVSKAAIPDGRRLRSWK